LGEEVEDLDHLQWWLLGLLNTWLIKLVTSKKPITNKNKERE
jgi:hypothetical protein